MGYKGATYEKGKVAFGSVGANYAGRALILDLSHSASALIVGNSLDAAVMLCIGDTEAFELDPNEGLFLSADAVNRHVDAGPIEVYYVGSAPTSGSIRVTAVL